VRLSLTYKFVLGSLLVAGTAGFFPELVARLGFAVEPWVTPFVALGVGGGLGFVLSRTLARNFAALRSTTERISQGDLTTRVAVSALGRFDDETHDLARSVHRIDRKSTRLNSSHRL